MAVYLSPVGGAGWQFFDNSGAPLTGGKIYTYAAGSTTPLGTYTTSVGSPPPSHTNPILLDAAGRVPAGGEIWLANGLQYKFVIKTSTDTSIATYDNISGLNNPTAAQVTYTPPFSGSVATNVQAKLAQTVSVKDFGAVGDGSTNDAAAINAAITAVLAAGGGTVYFPPGKYKCSTRIGTFVNVSNLTLSGYGAEIQNYAGSNVQGLMEFGNSSVDAYGMYSVSTTTVKNLNILGISFTSSNIFNGPIPGRWSDQLPISVNTAKNVVIRDCYFENWDFAAINFGALCRDCLVDSCSFYSSQIEAGHANYGVRAFCYANYTSYQNGNGDLSPTDVSTGVLKAGYALVSESSATWGHESINVTNCYFENASHGVMLSAARRGVVANNRFVNMSTRGVSLTTYSEEYVCNSNVFSLDTTQQTSSGVSTFYGIGQATYKHKIDNDKFELIGAVNNATGFTPVKCYFNSHNWVISNCQFDVPTFSSSSGARCINTDDNSDGYVLNNTFDCANIQHPLTFAPALTVTSPGFQQGQIWVIGNVFNAYSTGAIQIWDTTSAPETIIIKNNIDYGATTRFVVCNASASNKVCTLWLEGNDFVNGGSVRYVDNITANKAIIRNYDILTITTQLDTGGGVTTPSTTAVSFDYTARGVAQMYQNGTKMYSFTAYGGRENGNDGTGFSFVITGETATSVAGNIVRTGGSSFQYGYVSLNIQFIPLVT